MKRVALALATCAVTAGCVSLLGLDDVVFRAPKLEAGPDTVEIETRCPQTKGPAMVRVEGAPATEGVDATPPFCIDSTEVTVTHYLEFSKSAAPLNVESRCNWNINADAPAADAQGDLPVTGIDFCDALAFCSWSGKRLCGNADGKPTGQQSRLSAWYIACSAGGQRTFPYGATYSSKACNLGSSVERVRARVACQGGIPGVYDLGGNAQEWLDQCNPSATVDGGISCTTTDGLGAGRTGLVENDRKCEAAFAYEEDIKKQRSTLGFRCCASATD
jgi:formylglycine-generating enzyme